MRAPGYVTFGVLSLLALGCSTRSAEHAARSDVADAVHVAAATPELPGIAANYRAAVRPQAHAMRKPVRDARARALRALASNAAALRSESADWDHEARLVSLSPAQQSESRAAIDTLRTALADLETAAAANDLAAVRSAYARSRDAYQRVHALTAPTAAPAQ